MRALGRDWRALLLGDLRERRHGGPVTVSSEGRPQQGRPLLHWGDRHASPRPAGSLARLAAPRCDGRVDREPGGPKSRGGRHLRPMEGESRPRAGPCEDRACPGTARVTSMEAAPACTGRWCPRACCVAGSGASQVSLPPLHSCRVTPQASGARFLWTLWKLEWLMCVLVPQTHREPEPVPTRGP